MNGIFSSANIGEPVWFTPGLDAGDAYTSYWVRQANLRLRRELCWLWRQAQSSDAVAEALDRSRLHEERREFFAQDVTARYLTQALDSPEVEPRTDCARGTFPWLVRELELYPAAIFTTALVLVHSWDAAAAEVIGAVQGDARRTLPTLGMVQRLWEDAGAVAGLCSLSHPLFRLGVLRAETVDLLDWRTPLLMPAQVARRLLGAEIAPPAGITVIRSGSDADDLPSDARLVALGVSEPIATPHAIPVRIFAAGANATSQSVQALLRSFAKATGRPIYAPAGARPAFEIQTTATLCWLDGADLCLGLPAPKEPHEATAAPFTDIPIYLIALCEQEKLELPGWHVLPTIEIPKLDLSARIVRWKRSFPVDALPPESVLEDCAFRFRLDAAAIEEIARTLARGSQPVTAESLIAACRQRAATPPGTLATRVSPRFGSDELILPPALELQFNELVTALSTCSRVHARWGTGRVWNDAGISALFAGPPGTGKTMAAEVLAAKLGLPMYRVDLSQVVNKYIGETEKNLRRLFDSVEESDDLLFFDEADALFGQRMQVRNAHDRYANLEVSYLLQRMERFRGVAILATNRRKDLDEAFLRRLRFVLEFPLPDAPERKRIWESGIPTEVDGTALDFEFLARQFSISGGHIRSIILHACLQSAGKSSERKLEMETVIRSVRREYQKLDRTLTREQCGRWSSVLEEETK
jgi:hypothetical protein